MRPEPYIEEGTWYEEQELNHKKYMRGCPWCCICDERIVDSQCVQLEEGNFDMCAHEACYDKELRKMRRAGLSVAFEETIENLLFEDVHYITTPHEEGSRI